MKPSKAACDFGQHLVNQGPRYETHKRRQRNANQVISKAGVIRPDKRRKPKYL